MLELTYDEAVHILKKFEYSYRKKGSPVIDKLKEFIASEEARMTKEELKNNYKI